MGVQQVIRWMGHSPMPSWPTAYILQLHSHECASPKSWLRLQAGVNLGVIPDG